MTDIRKTTEKRTEILTVKLSVEEHDNLRWLAEKNFRRPADQLRLLLNEAVTRERKEHVDG